MAEINWRQLKRELLDSPPRQRNSPTFQHKDIFDNYSEGQRKSQGSGKKVFQQKNQTTQFDSANSKRLRKEAEHKQDHDNTFFFPHADLQRSLTARKTLPKDDSEKTVFKSPREMKRAELYECQIGNLVLLGMKKYEPLQQGNQPQMIDREFKNADLRKTTSQEKRLLHNESNIFFFQDFQQKTVLPIQQSKQKSKEINVKPYSKAQRIKSETSLIQKNKTEYKYIPDTHPTQRQQEKMSDGSRICIRNKILLRNEKPTNRHNLLDLAQKKK